MKNEMFKRLLGKFQALEKKNLLAGGRENLDNTWFYNLLDSLSEISNIMDQPKRNSDQVKAAFGNLEKATSAMISKGIEGIPAEMQGTYTAMLAAQKPIGFFANSLAEGKSLDETLNDPSWIKGLFAEGKRAVDRQDYVAGQYSPGDKTLKEVLDEYIKDADTARQLFEKHLKTISGDERNPELMLEEKVLLLQDFVNSLENKEANNLDISHVLVGYERAKALYSRDKTYLVWDGATLMGEELFGRLFGGLPNSSVVVDEINMATTIPSETSAILKDELNKIKISSKLFGVTNEMIERFDKHSNPLSALSGYYFEFQAEYQEFLDDHPEFSQNNKIDTALNEVNEIIGKFTAYIKGEDGAEAPTDESVVKAANDMLSICDGCKMFEENGKLSGLYDKSRDLFQGLCLITPKIAGILKTELEKSSNEFKVGFLNKTDELRSGKGSEDLIKRLEQNTNFFYDNGKIDREFRNQALYIRMAREPEFCKKMIEEASRAISNFAANQKTSPGESGSSYFSMTKMGSTEHIYTPEQVYGEAYTMYIVGKKIEGERKKIEASKASKATRADKLRNMVNPNFAGIFNAKTLGVEHIDAIKSVVADVRSSELFDGLMKGDPTAVNTIIKDSSVAKSMEKLINTPKLDFFKGVNSDTLNALTQSSGNFFTENSESYKKISNSIVEISKKNATMQGASIDDYMKLYNACKEYSYCHDSVPKSSNGKLRAAAAMDMMNSIGSCIAKARPEFAEQLATDKAVNMARSKKFRDAEVRAARNGIKELIANNFDDIKNGYSSLPKNVQNSIAGHLKTIGMAQGFDLELKDVSGVQISGKCNTKEAAEAISAKLASAAECSSRLMQRLQEDPMSVLEQFEPSLKAAEPVQNNEPEKKSSELQGPN